MDELHQLHGQEDGATERCSATQDGVGGFGAAVPGQQACRTAAEQGRECSDREPQGTV
ncbi:hypothetical protein ACIBTZ_03800 [Micromonospora sp. NPDC049460]|uniref:hypothetical protein n=1 Tax=Micromonospora sp. NPDC049460 TaxID=3364272 RepID=UPI0037B69B85